MHHVERAVCHAATVYPANTKYPVVCKSDVRTVEETASTRFCRWSGWSNCLTSICTDFCWTMLFYCVNIAGMLVHSTIDTAVQHGAVSTLSFTAGLEYLSRDARITLDWRGGSVVSRKGITLVSLHLGVQRRGLPEHVARLPSREGGMYKEIVTSLSF
jgi:hypothetical protein